MEEALNSLETRRMTPRVERLYRRLQERMTKKQKLWGGSVTVLNENTMRSSNSDKACPCF